MSVVKLIPLLDDWIDFLIFPSKSLLISGTTTFVSSFLQTIAYRGSSTRISSRNPSFSTIEYGRRSIATILPIALVIALALTLPFSNGVLRENVCWILSCVVELVEGDPDGLHSFRCSHKDPFPHDLDFVVELPRLTTFRHFLQVGFEASILFFMKLSQMFDGELLVRFLFSAVAI